MSKKSQKKQNSEKLLAHILLATAIINLIADLVSLIEKLTG